MLQANGVILDANGVSEYSSLTPRVTTTQKNSIVMPANGTVVHDITLNKLSVYTGSAWITVTDYKNN